MRNCISCRTRSDSIGRCVHVYVPLILKTIVKHLRRSSVTSSGNPSGAIQPIQFVRLNSDRGQGVDLARNIVIKMADKRKEDKKKEEEDERLEYIHQYLALSRKVRADKWAKMLANEEFKVRPLIFPPILTPRSPGD